MDFFTGTILNFMTAIYTKLFEKRDSSVSIERVLQVGLCVSYSKLMSFQNYVDRII